MFITFEGGEGSGKTTQVKLLGNYLEQQLNKGRIKGYFSTHQPGGGTYLNTKIRELLVKPEKDKMSDLTELFLFLADRAEHVSKFIKPNLDEGLVGICDRYIDSTMIYQGMVRKVVNIKTIKFLNSLATCDLVPDLTFYLDIDPEIGLDRKRKSFERNRFEDEKIEFHNQVREAFLLYSLNNERFEVINGNQPVQVIHQKIINSIENFI
jgi:dTMP kinase